MNMEVQEETYTHEPPSSKELYVSWRDGRWVEFGFLVVAAKQKCDDPIAEELFDLHAMETFSRAYRQNWESSKEWAYALVHDFAATRKANRRIAFYRQDWAHQAARDGLAIALWPEQWRGHRGEGLAKRAEKFGCSESSYNRLRDLVQDKALFFINQFKQNLDDACLGNGS